MFAGDDHKIDVSFERIEAGFFFRSDGTEFYSYLPYLVSDLSKIRYISANNVVKISGFVKICSRKNVHFLWAQIKLNSRLFYKKTSHFESKERLGKYGVTRNGLHHIHYYCSC